MAVVQLIEFDRWRLVMPLFSIASPCSQRKPCSDNQKCNAKTRLVVGFRACVCMFVFVWTDLNIFHCVYKNFFDFTLFNVRILPQIFVLLFYVCGCSRPAVTLTDRPMAINTSIASRRLMMMTVVVLAKLQFITRYWIIRRDFSIRITPSLW